MTVHVSYVSTDNASSCVLATLQCENKNCSAVISGVSRLCGFINIGAGTVSQPIQCCICTIGMRLPTNHNFGTLRM